MAEVLRCGGSLTNAVAYPTTFAIVRQRMDVLEAAWDRSGDPLPVELPQDESQFFVRTIKHCPMMDGSEAERLSTLDERFRIAW